MNLSRWKSVRLEKDRSIVFLSALVMLRSIVLMVADRSCLMWKALSES
jgi:hypothetical protein